MNEYFAFSESGVMSEILAVYNIICSITLEVKSVKKLRESKSDQIVKVILPLATFKIGQFIWWQISTTWPLNKP